MAVQLAAHKQVSDYARAWQLSARMPGQLLGIQLMNAWWWQIRRVGGLKAWLFNHGYEVKLQRLNEGVPSARVRCTPGS